MAAACVRAIRAMPGFRPPEPPERTLTYEEIVRRVLDQGQTTPRGSGQIVSVLYLAIGEESYRVRYDASDQSAGPLEHYVIPRDGALTELDRIEPWNGLTGRARRWRRVRR